MKHNIEISYLAFDLDGTLYSPSCGLGYAMDDRIDNYLCSVLGMELPAAIQLKERYFSIYGLTGIGLEKELGVDLLSYLEFVHDVPLGDFLEADSALANSLKAIPCRKVVFSNSIRSYAERVLQILGLQQCFLEVFTIENFGFINKPNKLAYQTLVDTLHIRPQTCIYFDDSIRNLAPAKDIRMRTALVHGHISDDSYPTYIDYLLPDIHEIEPFWKGLPHGEHIVHRDASGGSPLLI